MNEKLKTFKIEVDDIENVDFEHGMIQEIAKAYADAMDLIRYELVLNKNIITIKDKITGINSYMGMKVSLEPLEKDISFIVRPSNQPTYEQLQQENKQLKDNWNKLKEYLWNLRNIAFTKEFGNEWNNCLSFNEDVLPIINKMQELEKGDSNE